MNVLDYQNNEEVMGGYDLKILHDGSRIEQARFTPRHREERNVTQHLNGRYTTQHLRCSGREKRDTALKRPLYYTTLTVLIQFLNEKS
jgi:hypothetical protein